MLFSQDPSGIIEFTRAYLAIFFTLVALFFTVRIIFLKKIQSKEVVFPGERLSTSWWNHMVFRFFRVSIWLVCLFRFFFISIDDYLGMIVVMQNLWIIVVGNMFLTVGFISSIFIHFKMGEEWRSGIDPNGPGKLMTTGLYRYSRNPMFLSVAVAQFGFFLALPSAFSLICLFIGWITLYRQVLVEEQHLLKTFSEEYKDYSSHVPRWVFK